MTKAGRTVAAFMAAAALALSGCATAPVPGSVGEQLWFDQAQGLEIHHVSPAVRVLGAIGYPRAGHRLIRRAPLLIEEP